MAEVLLFHHIQGLTPGLVGFADRLRAAGHTVHTPDLFEGNTFATIPSGMVAKVLPSNRSGVCTVWPAVRSRSANSVRPGVRPWTWWKRRMSAMPPP